TAEDFAGADVEVKLGIEKRRGFPDRNIIEDYRAAAASVVNLRSVAKALAFVGGVSLAALSTACSSVPGAVSSMPYYVDQRPAYYGGQAAYQPQRYGVSNFPVPVPVNPSPAWQNGFGNMAMGAGVGAVGGALANRALTGAETHAVASGAEHAAERTA